MTWEELNVKAKEMSGFFYAANEVTIYFRKLGFDKYGNIFIDPYYCRGEVDSCLASDKSYEEMYGIMKVLK